MIPETNNTALARTNDEGGAHAAELVDALLARCVKKGAYAADALLVEQQTTSVRVRGDDIEHLTQARERTLGLRVFVAAREGLRVAHSSSGDTARGALDALAAQTLALARAAAPDPHAGLPEDGFANTATDGDGDAGALELFDPAEREVEIASLLQSARAAEASARACDPRIVNSEGSDADAGHARVHYANSRGFAGSYECAQHALGCAPVAAENAAMQTSFWVSQARSSAALETPAAVGARAARRALAQLGARSVRTCEVPVIFDPLAARALLGNLAACLLGAPVYRGGSFLAARAGERVASTALSITDDGRRRAGLGTRPFDAEGLPTRRTPVIERGVLRNFLLDSYAARKLKLASTGNAARSAAAAPSAAPSNLWLHAGDADPQEMLRSCARGLLVTELFGHGFNPVTGDFSRGARGFWIENGERAHPVEEVTVAGNLGAALETVDAVGNDLLWQGRSAAPSLRFARLTVAGNA